MCSRLISRCHPCQLPQLLSVEIPFLFACAAGSVDSSPTEARIQAGRAIRQLKAHWKLGVVLVPLLELPAAAALGLDSARSSGTTGTSPSAAAAGAASQQEGDDLSQAQLMQHMNAVQGLLSVVAGFGLEECWQWKPLLDGKQVRFACGVCQVWWRYMSAWAWTLGPAEYETGAA